MKIHFCDHNDNEKIVEIDETEYRAMLTEFDGQALLDEFLGKMKVIDRDPRLSDLEDCRSFLSAVDLRTGFVTAAEILDEIVT